MPEPEAGNLHMRSAARSDMHTWQPDKTGRMIIPPRFADGATSGFFHGLARVWVEDKMAYIDKTGKYVWAPTK